jgi:hypothetical protein
MFFGKIVGVQNQGVRGTATAQVVNGNMTECLKPWAIIDRWDEFNGTEPDFPNPDPDFDALSTFDRYSTGQGNSPPQENDLYVPPTTQNGSGTGFKLPGDFGRQFAIKVDSNTNSTVSPGWFRAIRLPRLDGQNGGNVYRSNIESCGGLPSSYADPATVCPANIGNDDAAYWAERGCYAVETGNMVGPTGQGIDVLKARDSGASWSESLNKVVGSAFDPWTSSPRVVPIGVIDINSYMAQDPSGANGVLKMVNIYGFFVEGMGEVNADGSISFPVNNGKAVIGRIVTLPSSGGGLSTLPSDSSFLRQVILVR